MKGLNTFRGKGFLLIWAVFLAMGAILFVERSGVQYQEYQMRSVLLDSEKTITAKEAAESIKKTCLLVTDSRQPASELALEQFEQIFLDMKVGYLTVDISKESLPDFADFDTAVLLLSDVSPLEMDLLELADWVYAGGRALFAVMPDKEPYITMIEQKLGIISSGYNYRVMESVYPDPDFMLGGGGVYVITDPFESSREVELGEKVRVLVRAGGADGFPVIWKNDYGKGCFVVDNLGFYEKSMRGFYAASYSFLEDAFAYPVINGATFYLDDFPSPVPAGNGEFIQRDYGMSISDFYANVWWPDLMELAEKFGIKYTGVMIENYEDDTDGEIAPVIGTERFQYFGSMLLRMGGEIGFHGYNHQPFSLSNTDYGTELPYKTWESEGAMISAMQELIRFGGEMFPGMQQSVYVPPSNVLSKEGREMLAQHFPQIRTVASTYFPGEFAYEQEFGVAEDGIVEQPRIISGCILDDYMKLVALSELNMHMVSNHFMHPDDLLDEDRGGAIGWEALKGNLERHEEWLYTSTTDHIRSLTGSELSGAVQRYAAVTVERIESEETLTLQLGNFYDEAYLLVRFNDGKPGETAGGTLTLLTDSLYLLHAENETVTVDWIR